MLVSAAFGQNFLLPSYTVNSGGVPGVSMSYALNGSAGQSVQGTGTSASYLGYWGFWYGLARPGDVGVVQILAPGALVDTGSDITPRVKFHNYSTLDKASFGTRVQLISPTLGQVYDSVIGVSQLLPGRDTTLTFPVFNVGADTGFWQMNAFCALPGDTNPDNDSMGMQFEVAGRPPWPPGWDEVTPMPLAPSSKAVKDGGWLAMHTGNGLIYAAKGNKTGDFYSYEAIESTWATLTLIPNGNEAKPPSKGCMGVTDNGGYVYLTKGNNTQGFWRYSIDSLTWTQFPVVPMGPSGKRVKGGTDMVYVTEADTGYVYLLKGYKQDFFRFNTVTGVWDTSLPLAPTGMKGKWDKGSWLAHDGGTKLYAHKAKYHEMWEFDLATHTWGTAALPGMPLTGMMGKSKKSKDGGSAAYDGGYLYALKGGNTQEFWKCGLPGAVWTELETMPAFGSTGKKKRVKAGADIAAYGGGVFFALKGNKTLEMWRYVAALSYGLRPERSGVMAEPTGLTELGLAVAPNPVTGGRAELRYVIPGAGAAQVRVYDITGRSVLSRSLVAGRSGTVTLDLGRLARGVYVMKFTAPGYSADRKLVIE
jgi:hypothetical protein